MRSAPNNEMWSALWITDQAKAIKMCQRALKKHKGHRGRAAEELRISSRALYRRLAEHPEILAGLDHLQFKPSSRTLTALQVRRIRERLAFGEKGSDIAKDLNISKSSVSLIGAGKRHKSWQKS